MGVDAGTPPGLWERVRMIVAEEIGKFMRSGFLRNASISDGGLTIKGGFLSLLFGKTELFYIGPVLPNLPDGTGQQGILVRRADGSLALALFDAFPDPDGTLRQAMTWWDREGNIVIADDTESGQGIARPYVSGGFTRSRYQDWSVSTTSSEWEDLHEQMVYKQHPKLEVATRASTDTAGATGQVRVVVDDVPLGDPVDVAFVKGYQYFGPELVDGDHMQPVVVKIQGRRTSGTGALRVEPRYWVGRQT